MKTLLINPPWFILEEAELGQNATPSGLCYLAAAIEKENMDVKILNAERTDKNYYYDWTKEINAYEDFRARDIKKHPVWNKVIEKVKRYNPDIIGITVRTPALESAMHLCQLLKNINSDIPIILGGPHPTVMPEELLKSENIDFIIRGEGEETIVELIKCLIQKKDFSGVKGLSYKENGVVKHNCERPLLELTELSPPAKHLMLDLDEHDQDDFNPIMTSRGCPYSCIFCGSSNIWGRAVRFRRPIDVINEMKDTYERFDTRFFSFDDDTFTFNKPHVEELCNLIIDFELNKIPGFRWTCNTRPERLDLDLLKLMRKAGCAAVAIGIESGNDRILKKIKKSYTSVDVRKAASLIKEAGMVLAGQFIIGFPFETEEEMRDTVKLAEEIEAESVKVSVATPLPNTVLYDIAMEEGYFPDGINWSDVMLHNDGILFNKVYSDKDKKRIMNEIISEFERIQNKTIDEKVGRIKQYESMYKTKN